MTRLAGLPFVLLFVGLIRLYRYTLSAFIGRHCRYLPTCSEYTETAIRRHGPWAGLWMGVARFSRCNPLGGSGFDPVPEERPEAGRWYLPWRYGVWRLAESDTTSSRDPQT